MSPPNSPLPAPTPSPSSLDPKLESKLAPWTRECGGRNRSLSIKWQYPLVDFNSGEFFVAVKDYLGGAGARGGLGRGVGGVGAGYCGTERMGVGKGVQGEGVLKRNFDSGRGGGGGGRGCQSLFWRGWGGGRRGSEGVLCRVARLMLFVPSKYRRSESAL